jgi:hypothetical protein
MEHKKTNPQEYFKNREEIYRRHNPPRTRQEMIAERLLDATPEEEDQEDISGDIDRIYRNIEAPDVYDESTIDHDNLEGLYYNAPQEDQTRFDSEAAAEDVLPTDVRDERKKDSAESYFTDATKTVEEKVVSDRDTKIAEAELADKDLAEVFGFEAPTLTVDTEFSNADVAAAKRMIESDSYFTGDFAYAIYTGKLSDEVPVLRKRSDESLNDPDAIKSGSMRIATIKDSKGNKISIPIAGLNELIIDYTYPEEGEITADGAYKAQMLINERANKVYSSIQNRLNDVSANKIYARKPQANKVMQFIMSITDNDKNIDLPKLKEFLEKNTPKDQLKALQEATKKGQYIKFAYELAKLERDRISEDVNTAARTLFEPSKAQNINDRNDTTIVLNRSSFTGVKRKTWYRMVSELIDNSGVWTGDQRRTQRKKLNDAYKLASEPTATKGQKDAFTATVVDIMYRSVVGAIRGFKANAHRLEFGKAGSRNVISKKLEFMNIRDTYMPSYIAMHDIIKQAIDSMKQFKDMYLSTVDNNNAEADWLSNMMALENAMPPKNKLTHISFIVNGLMEEGVSKSGLYYTNINAVNANIFSIYDYLHSKYNCKAYNWTYFLNPENQKSYEYGPYIEGGHWKFKYVKAAVADLVNEYSDKTILKYIKTSDKMLLASLSDNTEKMKSLLNHARLSKSFAKYLSTANGSKFMDYIAENIKEKYDAIIRVAVEEEQGRKLTRGETLQSIKDTPITPISELEIELKESGLIPKDMQLAMQKLIPTLDVTARYENWKKSFKPVDASDMGEVLKTVTMIPQRGDIAQLRGSKERWKPIWGIQPYEGIKPAGSYKRLATFDDILIGDKVPIGYSESMRYEGETNNPYEKDYFIFK